MAERRKLSTGGWSSVRVRTTLAAVLVVAVAVGVGSLVMLGALRSALLEGVEQVAEQRTSDIAEQLSSGNAVLSALSATDEDEDEEFVQVVATDRDVLASSANVRGRPAVVPGADTDEAVRVAVVVDGESEDMLVIATDVEFEGRDVAVIVGRSLGDVDEPVQAVRSILWIAGPVMILLVAATTWFVVGRALAPVDRIRREVEEITFSEMHRRVPVPGARDEVARLAETMNGMLARLANGQERQRRFVGDASHELRSPVASLRQHAEVAIAHVDRVDATEFAEVVLAESLRMQRLVDDLLLLARADAGSMHTVRRPVDVDDLVFEEARRLRGAAEIRIDTSAVGAGRVLGDLNSLSRVVRNLGDNAVRHASSTVWFVLETTDTDVVVHIDDDGSGIAAEHRPSVLERFVRLDEGRDRDAGGAGLGLAIAREVIAAHGGHLSIADSPAGGARVTVRLPVLPD